MNLIGLNNNWFERFRIKCIKPSSFVDYKN